MLTLAWFAATGALAGSLSPDPERVCASEERVALSPTMRKRFRAPKTCTTLVSSESIGHFMKAFAVYSRELHDPQTADQLVRHLDARWLLLEDGSDFRVYDGQAKAFVDNAVFAPPGSSAAEVKTPADTAYRLGFQALRSKRYDDAGKHLAECLAHDQDHVGCQWELGWVHWVAEDWAAAQASWTEVERRAPDHPHLDEWLVQARAKTKALVD